MQLINNRYEIIDILESDMYGNVYHVVDLQSENRPFRLKLLSLEMSDTEVVKYFKMNFINLVTIVHEHLLSNYEFEIVTSIDGVMSLKKQYFYTSEYYDRGEALSFSQLNSEERLSAIKQICYVLEYLHFRGVVYKFLSPMNLHVYRVDDEIRVKLLDVASMHSFATLLSAKEDYIKQFFAPEVLRNDSTSVESDIYSLGILIFYLVHNIDPRETNFREVFNDSSDLDIDRLISVMTFNNPHERYQTIQEFVAAIQAIYSFDYPFWDRKYYEKLNFLTPLIGRERLKERSMDLIEHKLKSQKDVRMLLIEGEAGSGKSRFINEVVFLNRINNIQIASVELNTKHTGGFFSIKKMLRDIMRQYVLNPLLIKKYGPELVKILPEMADRWKVLASEPLEDPQAEEMRLINRILNFLIEFVASNPLIIVIDNLHFISRQEMQLLDFLMESKRQLPLAIICSYRDDLLEYSNELQSWMNSGKAERQTVNKFNYSEAAEMIAAVLGIGERPMELTTKIMTEAVGNPKYIEEVLKNLYMFEYLFVNDQRMWEMNVEYIKELELPLRVDDIITHPVDSLDSDSLTVLQAISVFEVPVSFEILSHIINFERVKLELVLNKLVAIKILNRKLGDWGYRYDFYNKRFRKLVFSGISDAVRLEYHQRASNILERLYTMDSRMQSEDLIYHLIHSNQLEEAAKYAVESARKMEKLNIHRQAIEFYTKALELMQKLNHDEQIARLMIQLSEIQMKMNETDRAVATLEEAHAIAERNNDKRALVDIWNLRAEISLLKKDLSGLMDYADRSLLVAKNIQYLEGELDASLIICRLYLAQGDAESIRDITDYYLPITRSQKLTYYFGRFLNELGIYYIQTNQVSDAFKTFHESYNYLEKSSNDFDMTRPLNNLGLLSFDFLGDVEKSREYYSKAIEITDRMNITWGKDMLYSNISESYLKEDRYNRALAYLSDAIRIAESSGTHDVLFYIYSNLCIANFETSRFDEAYRYLIKLEYEYRSRKGKALYEGFYHSNHVHYFIRIKDYEKAYEWYEKAKALDVAIPENIEFGLKLNKIRLDIFTGNLQNGLREKLFENLSTIIKASTNPTEIKDVRDLILDIGYEYLQAHKLMEVQKLLDIDEQLIESFNTDKLAVKRALLSGVAETDSITYFEELLVTIKDKPYNNEQWICHFLLGNAYLDDKDFYSAMVQYANALRILRQITYLIPEEQRSNFIMNDDSKQTLYGKVQYLMDLVLNRKRPKVTLDALMPETVEAFFDTADYQRILKNKRFLKSVRMSYQKRYGMDVDSVDTLMSALGTSEYDNIKLIIEYLMQECFADRGSVHIFDGVQGIQETICGFGLSDQEDISRYINMLEDDSEGICLQSFDRHKTFDLLDNEARGILLIPIVSHKYKQIQKQTFKRRYDHEVARAKTIGYLFLTSDKSFNNFTQDTFKKCRSFVNLLYVMLDNYELKKMSSVDKLTGVYLRKHIEELYSEELNRAKDKHYELSVVMADIDHFKNVNDMYGHQKGDEILRSIGDIFKAHLREEDMVGRYGGEEFIIILPKTGEIDAFNVCEKIRQVIESSNLLGSDHPLTMSYGISSFPAHGIIEQELIEKADQALYESKHMGRNRSTIWTPYIGDTKLRFDKLAGILVGNISADTRKVQSIVDIMSLINRPINREAKIYETLSQLIDICEADTATLLSFDEDGISESFTREVGLEQMFRDYEIPEHIVNQTIQSEFGEVFIDWKEPLYTEDMKTPDWLSYVVIPLVNNGVRKGLIVLSVSVARKEFDFDVFNYVNTLNGVISVIMYGDKR